MDFVILSIIWNVYFCKIKSKKKNQQTSHNKINNNLKSSSG